MAYDNELADRIRAALETQKSLREVKMFGGLSFMVNDAMVMNVGSSGDLLVRVDPERDKEYLQVKGTHEAEMGQGRTMGPGWLAVAADSVATDEDLAFWVDATLDFNRKGAGKGKSRRSSKKPKAAS